MEVRGPELLAELPEAVDVAVAQLAPVDKLDAQLEGALGFADELVLVQFHDLVEQPNGGNGGFADTYRTDIF